MAFVSITRLRLRSLRFLPGFAIGTIQALGQARTADGFIGGSVLPDRRLTFWTMTLWRVPDDMRAYIVSGPHLRTMPRLLNWCDEASVVHWTQEDPVAPDWPTADRRMRAEGRPSKVHYPGRYHASLDFAAPRTSRAVPIERR